MNPIAINCDSMYPPGAVRILFVVDGRSPIALNWIRYFTEGERRAYEVHLVSTFPCSPGELQVASLQVIRAPFSHSGGERETQGRGSGGGGLIRRLLPVGMRTSLRQWLSPLTLPAAANDLNDLIDRIQPDLIHAMRIPYEGMLAAMALKARANPPPLLISVWGNDFTLHARATPRMASLTRQALRGAAALHADCQRDIRLAREWGFDQAKPNILLPGGGGVQLDLFYPPSNPRITSPVEIINPRGLRAYVRNDVFFQAVPIVWNKLPEVRFVCPAMAGEAQAERWVRRLDIHHAVRLLPRQTRPQMADLFRRCEVAVSPSTHDGTPNTLLEAMACGCFPVAGDIESLQEWITPGVNGLLVDPRDPQALAVAILKALEDPDLRRRAMKQNTRLVSERAEYGRVMAKAEAFYQGLISR